MIKQLLAGVLLFGGFATTIWAGPPLLNVYKKGPIKLAADPEFGKNTDWQKLFAPSSKDGQPSARESGALRTLAVAANGAVFASLNRSCEIFRFDNKGMLVSRFGKKGKLPGEFPETPRLSGIMDDQNLLIRLYQGKFFLFSLDGNFIKTTTVNYPVENSVALKGMKAGLTATIANNKSMSKEIVAILDLASGKEKILVSKIQETSAGMGFKVKGSVKAPKGGGIRTGGVGEGGGFSVSLDSLSNTIQVLLDAPYARAPKIIRETPEGNLLVGFSHQNELSLFSPDGAKMRGIQLNITPLQIGEKVRKEYLDSALRSIPRSLEMIQKQGMAQLEPGSYEAQIRETISNPNFFPKSMPYYYNFLVDSDGNILVFPYTETNGIYRFRVYSPDGQYLCDSAIDPGEYKIWSNALSQNLVFHKGALYALVGTPGQEGASRIIRVSLN